MQTRRCAAIVVSVLSVLVAACGGEGDGASSGDGGLDESTSVTEQDTGGSQPTTTVAATTTPSTTTTTTAVESPDLALVEAGPYDVGVTTITVDDGVRDRPLTVDVWFPLADAATGDPQQYTFIPTVYYESPTAVAAVPADIATDGPFPLVVQSHGNGGIRYYMSNFTETIASHGYIVAAPDHSGNTVLDSMAQSTDPVGVIALNRPNDVTAVIDAMTDGTNPASAGLVSHVDAERIAVSGHSFGGFTAFAVATGFENDVGSYPADDRVDAIVALAPFVPDFLSDEMLAAVDVPVMMLVGTDDKTTPIDPHVTRPWELIGGDDVHRVELLAAEHQSFTDVCDYVEFLPRLEAVPEIIVTTIDSLAEAGCLAGDMPIDRVQELTNTFTIAFLEQTFRDGPGIDPDTTTIPDDVRYLVR